MAYSTTNPPKCHGPRLGAAEAIFTYSSADSAAAIAVADYFSNGADLGMQVGDAVIALDTATPACTTHIVSAVSAAGAATVV